LVNVAVGNYKSKFKDLRDIFLVLDQKYVLESIYKLRTVYIMLCQTFVVKRVHNIVTYVFIVPGIALRPFGLSLIYLLLYLLAPIPKVPDTFGGKYFLFLYQVSQKYLKCYIEYLLGPTLSSELVEINISSIEVVHCKYSIVYHTEHTWRMM
jgi:hypothetical protein